MPASSSTAIAIGRAIRLGAEFDEEHRDAERQRQRDDQGEDRGDDGADDRAGGAIILGDRVPGGRGDEAEPEFVEGRPAADHQADHHAGERRHQQRRGGEAQGAEDRLARRTLRAGGPGLGLMSIAAVLIPSTHGFRSNGERRHASMPPPSSSPSRRSSSIAKARAAASKAPPRSITCPNRPACRRP